MLISALESQTGSDACSVFSLFSSGVKTDFNSIIESGIKAGGKILPVLCDSCDQADTILQAMHQIAAEEKVIVSVVSADLYRFSTHSNPSGFSDLIEHQFQGADHFTLQIAGASVPQTLVDSGVRCVVLSGFPDPCRSQLDDLVDFVQLTKTHAVKTGRKAPLFVWEAVPNWQRRYSPFQAPPEYFMRGIFAPKVSEKVTAETLNLVFPNLKSLIQSSSRDDQAQWDMIHDHTGGKLGLIHELNIFAASDPSRT